MKQMSFIYTSLKSKLACLKVPNRYPSEFGIPSTPPSLPSLLFPAPLLSYTNLPLQFGQWLLLTSRKLLTTTTALRRRWRQAANLVYRENNSTLITNGHSLFQCHIWKIVPLSNRLQIPAEIFLVMLSNCLLDTLHKNFFRFFSKRKINYASCVYKPVYILVYYSCARNFLVLTTTYDTTHKGWCKKKK